MGYINDESKVRADIFKPSGKWYESISLDMTNCYNIGQTSDAVIMAFLAQRPSGLETGWKLVVLEPYHHMSHPIMIVG